MKKIALVFASLALAATPVFACPHGESSDDAAAPKTAEKAKSEKDSAKSTDQAKAKTAPAKKTTEPKTAKPAEKTEPKKNEKVSAR